jgi:pimeloyl-ACP methyl ester carboxylesterase
VSESWYRVDDNPVRRDELLPYLESETPYYEYSSLQRPLRPLVPPPLSSPPPQTPTQPQRSRNKGLLLILAVVSVILVLVLVSLSVLSYVLFLQPPAVKTPVTTLPTQAPARPVTPTANYRSAPCPFQLGDGIVEGQTLKCGFVTVPENRTNPNGATVQLAVAIFKSPNVQHDPYPVIRLEGGPGGPSLDNWAHFFTSANYSRFVFNHDLIMFDQRGTGYSTPSLKCPETLQVQSETLNMRLSATDSERLQLQALSACHDRLLRSGVDLNAFNSLENAADVHDVIQALGYKQANLYGVSYGTRLALTTMRLFPSVIRSVVLDSVYPPQENRNELPGATQRVFNVLFQGCAAQAHCDHLYPHLDSVFYQLVTELNASPAHFQAIDTTTNRNYNVVMAGDDLVFVLFQALYLTQAIPVLPQMIFQIRDHSYTLLSQIYGTIAFDQTFSDGMFYAVECSEDWGFLTQHDITAALQGIAPQIQPALHNDLQTEYDACRLWHVQKSPAAQKQAVVSAIPTLVLSDEYDPITPPANGKLAAQTLQNSYYFLFPGLGHGAEYNSPCVDTIISTFEDTPTQKPSGACVAGMGEPNFV